MQAIALLTYYPIRNYIVVFMIQELILWPDVILWQILKYSTKLMKHDLETRDISQTVFNSFLPNSWLCFTLTTTLTDFLLTVCMTSYISLHNLQATALNYSVLLRGNMPSNKYWLFVEMLHSVITSQHQPEQCNILNIVPIVKC